MIVTATVPVDVWPRLSFSVMVNVVRPATGRAQLTVMPLLLAEHEYAGRFRLPIAVDPTSVPAVVTAVLAGVHAEQAGAAAGKPEA